MIGVCCVPLKDEFKVVSARIRTRSLFFKLKMFYHWRINQIDLSTSGRSLTETFIVPVQFKTWEDELFVEGGGRLNVYVPSEIVKTRGMCAFKDM